MEIIIDITTTYEFVFIKKPSIGVQNRNILRDNCIYSKSILIIYFKFSIIIHTCPQVLKIIKIYKIIPCFHLAYRYYIYTSIINVDERKK